LSFIACTKSEEEPFNVAIDSAAVNHKSKYLILSGCLAPRWPQSQIPQYPCPLNRIRVELGGSVIPVEKAGYFLPNKQSYRKLPKLLKIKYKLIIITDNEQIKTCTVSMRLL
jgi:hypothetical protein